MDRRDFLKYSVAVFAGAAVSKPALNLISNQTRRIVFFADTHYCDDPARNSGLTWTANSNKNIAAALKLKPQHIHWLGDAIDFNLSEYSHVKSAIQKVKKTLPEVDIHALMGNHDYQYYKWPEIFDKFPDDLSQEIEFTISKKANSGQNTIYVNEDVRKAVVGHAMLLLGLPGNVFPPKYDILKVKSVNVQDKSITFTYGLTRGYSLGDFAGQGWSNTRAIQHFRNAFSGTSFYNATTPKSTKYFYSIGNVLFIFFSTDQYHPVSNVNPELYCGPPSDVDLDWLESVVAENYRTSNIIIQTHMNPASGSEIGTADLNNIATQYEPKVQARFKSICQKYNVPLWMFGHVHANWLQNFQPDKVRISEDGPTYICVKPHVANVTSKPGSGSDWPTNWKESGTGGNIWSDGRSYTVNGDVVLNRPGTWGDTSFCLLPTTGQLYTSHMSNEGQIVAVDLTEGLAYLKLKAY